MTTITLLPYIPPHKPRHRPPQRIKVVYGHYASGEKHPTVVVGWASPRKMRGIPEGFAFVSFPYSGLIVTAGRLAGVRTEATARLEGVWI